MKALKRVLRWLVLSFGLLTVIPVRGEWDDGGDLGKSVMFFPLAGFIAGAASLLASYFLARKGMNILAGSMAVATEALITGGLHLDGMADTCDGFFSGKDRDKALSVMRDSRVGAMGVIGVVIILLLKFALITTIADRLIILIPAILIAPVSGKAVIGLSAYFFRYAREDGMAKQIIGNVNPYALAVNMLISVALAFAFGGVTAVIGLSAGVLFGLAFAAFASRRLKGITGDILGAANEVSGVVCLFLMAVL